MVTDHRE